MATILTIHGTFAQADSDTGQAWWQKSSELERDLRRWLDTDDKRLEIEPFRWSGANSEASRYDAAKRLADRIVALEARREDYVLVGHSHGGSVIAQALALAVTRTHHLARLRRWITVGTPFIAFKERPLLFSKLTRNAKSAYLTLAYIAMAYLAFVFSFFAAGGFDNPPFDITISVIGLIFLASFYVVLRRFRSDKIKLIKSATKKGFERELGPRWLALWHASDEAVQGFKLIRRVRIAPFRPEFAVSVLASFSIVAGPVVLYLLLQRLSYDTLVTDIQAWAPDFMPTGSPNWLEQFARDTLAILASPSRFFFDAADLLGLDSLKSTAVNRAVIGVSLLGGGAIGFLVLWALSWLVYVVIDRLARRVSGFISLALNKAAETQLRRLLFGEDTLGELAVGAREAPAWLPATAPLPGPLADEIAERSYSATAASITKMRAELGLLVFAEQTDDVAKVLGDYLTWEELIHTTYFRVERFRKLLAFALGHSPGFHESDALKNDPQRAELAAWYDAIRATGGTAPAGAEVGGDFVDEPGSEQPA